MQNVRETLFGRMNVASIFGAVLLAVFLIAIAQKFIGQYFINFGTIVSFAFILIITYAAMVYVRSYGLGVEKGVKVQYGGLIVIVVLFVILYLMRYQFGWLNEDFTIVNQAFSMLGV